MIGGVFISIVLMLYYAIRGLISVGQDPTTSVLVDNGEAEETDTVQAVDAEDELVA